VHPRGYRARRGPRDPLAGGAGRVAAAPATREELADDYVYFTHHMAQSLQMILVGAHYASEANLYSSLSRPAQVAWDRLVTQLFAKLPPSPQLAICMMLSDVGGPTPLSVLRDAAPALFKHVQSGDLVIDCGADMRQWFGDVVYSRLGLACFTTQAELPLKSQAAAPAWRRLSLLAYEHLLSHFEPADQAPDRTELEQVR
jgi:hypothetical protein